MLFDQFTIIAQGLGDVINFAGILVIASGMIFAALAFLSTAFAKGDIHKQYQAFRNNMARAILLGLELLLAGDIIRSATGTPNFESVLFLGMIVVIRTFLGITFEMEVEGKWPWHRGRSSSL